jgi:hypothetical protein
VLCDDSDANARNGARARASWRRPRAFQRWIALTCLAWAGATGRARADPNLELQMPTAPSQMRAFSYLEPQQPDYLRATLEEITLLGFGFAQYLANQRSNSVDWDFGYDWDGLRGKLGGNGYSFDTNDFHTNFLKHPAAGTLYYWAARTNRLTVLESFAYAVVASTLWEYFFEFRERASINDILVTPVAGLVLGEMTVQLGAFFDRSCDSLPNKVLADVLGPMKSIHDALDGARPARDVQCDRYGFSRRGEHEFRFSLAAGALFSTSEPSAAVRFETQFGLHTRIVALETYGSEGRGYTTFADGNVSEFWLHGAFADSGWTDFTMRSTVILLGLQYRSLARSSEGLSGDEVLLGLLVGTEYDMHRFGVGAEQQHDRYFALDVPGVSMAYRRFMGAIRLELELQTSVALAGIDPFALPEYLVVNSIEDLATVARDQRYNYAAGLRVNPRARLIGSWFEVGVDFAGTRLWVINQLDRRPDRQSHVSVSELRSGASAWLSAGPRSWPLRFRLTGDVLQRSGVIANTHADRAELRVSGGVEVVL